LDKQIAGEETEQKDKINQAIEKLTKPVKEKIFGKELTKVDAALIFVEALQSIYPENPQEKLMLNIMREDISAISSNVLTKSGNPYERFRSEEWAIDAGITTQKAREFAAKVYNKAAEIAKKRGFNADVIELTAKFLEGK